jgi:hypothetical protein
MGAVYKPSLKDLRQVLKCRDRQINKIGKQMSKAVIRGSMKICRQDTCRRHEEYQEQEQKIIQKKIIEVKRVEVEAKVPRKEENDEENELEDDEEIDKWDIEEERDGPRDEDQERQESGRNQFRSYERWIREKERGGTEDTGNVADHQGGGMPE